MPQLDPALKDPMVVELASVSAGPITPVGDGAFVEPEGGDDGLDGTAVQRSVITRVTRSADFLSR